MSVVRGYDADMLGVLLGRDKIPSGTEGTVRGWDKNEPFPGELQCVEDGGPVGLPSV